MSNIENEMLPPFTDWTRFLPNNNLVIDIINNPAPEDQRLNGWKGIYKNLNQGYINDHFKDLEENDRVYGEKILDIRNDVITSVQLNQITIRERSVNKRMSSFNSRT